MTHYYWNDWYSGWGWFLWFGIWFLIIASFGNWGYTYRAHRRFEGGQAHKSALEILNERYARGDIDHEQYAKIRSYVVTESNKNPKKESVLSTHSPVHSTQI